jgi:NADPH:quinone reductase-like Zn-dependent oxidoreductase
LIDKLTTLFWMWWSEKTSYTRFKNSLTPKGYYLAVAGELRDMLQMIRTSFTGGKKVKFGGGSACEKKENLLFLCKLIENGKLKPVPNRTFPFEELAEAHRYVETGSKRGNIVVSIP